jgi:hypothetical protein
VDKAFFCHIHQCAETMVDALSLIPHKFKLYVLLALSESPFSQLVILEWPTSLQMSQILKMSLAKPQRTPRKTFAILAYMDVGQGRKQDAEALRLGERKCFLLALSV